MGSPGHHGQPRLLSTVGELLLRRRRLRKRILRRRRPTPACGSLLSVARVPPLPESTWSAWRAGLHRPGAMHCFEVCTHFAPLALHQLACARLGFSGPARGNDSRGLRGPRARCRSAGCARAASGGPSRGRRGCLSAAGTMSQMRGNARAPRRAKSRAPGGQAARPPQVRGRSRPQGGSFSKTWDGPPRLRSACTAKTPHALAPGAEHAQRGWRGETASQRARPDPGDAPSRRQGGAAPHPRPRENSRLRRERDCHACEWQEGRNSALGEP